MRKIAILCALAGAAAIASPAAAQDTSADPNYGTLQLSAGFTPDPRTVNVTAGGDRDASRLGGGCAGMISNAPDVRVVYNGGGSLPLIFTAQSDGDTTLVINAPDGRWYCNDDANGLNPGIAFNNAGSGSYEIWVGQLGNGGSGARALLRVSEIRN